MRYLKNIIRKQFIFGDILLSLESLEGHGKELGFGSKNLWKLLEVCEQGTNVIQLNILKGTL